MNYLLTHQETERLKFRLLEPEDFDNWVPLFEAQNVAKHLELDISKSPVELCEIWFDKAFHRYDNNLGGMNALVDKETNQLIGQAGLLIQTVGNEERLEIGYSILPRFWKMGYAFEAAARCKNFAFENNFADSLISMVHEENIGSEKVALKNGMTFEQNIKRINIFSIKKEEWQQLS